MLNYIIRRLFLIIPTLVGIVIINFLIIQGAPGGPVEQTLAKIQGTDVEATARVSPDRCTVASRASENRHIRSGHHRDAAPRLACAEPGHLLDRRGRLS